MLAPAKHLCFVHRICADQLTCLLANKHVAGYQQFCLPATIFGGRPCSCWSAFFLLSSKGCWPAFLLLRPGKFRWEYVKPYRQTIVADGNKIWLFDNELEQITVKSQSDALIGTPALLLSGERSLHDDFAVEKVSTAGKDTTLVLRTKRTDVNFSTIKMVFRDILLHQMEFVDGLGQTTRLDFSDLKHNKSILPSAFVLAIPEGVDVIGAD